MNVNGLSISMNNVMAFVFIIGISMVLSFLRILPSGSGNFYLVLLGFNCMEVKELVKFFHLFNIKGLIIENTGEIFDCIYGRSYNVKQVFDLVRSCCEDKK